LAYSPPHRYEWRLFVRAAARELGHDINMAAAEALQRRHGELFREFLPSGALFRAP